MTGTLSSGPMLIAYVIGIFLSLCLQLAHEALYQAIAQAVGRTAKSDDTTLIEYLEDFIHGNERDFNGVSADNMRPLLEKFLAILQRKGTPGERLALLKEIMAAVSVTASDDSSEKESDSATAEVSFEKIHTLTPSDVNYGIFTMGANYDIGPNKSVTVRDGNGNEYKSHTHSSIKGRIGGGGLKDIFRKNGWRAGDKLRLSYNAGTMTAIKAE